MNKIDTLSKAILKLSYLEKSMNASARFGVSATGLIGYAVYSWDGLKTF